jgi:methylase of polypeptide subunit release factors
VWKLAMLAASKSELNAILDFPCGHGRVLRNLKAAFPNAEITACDLDRKAKLIFVPKLFSAIHFTQIRSRRNKIDRQFDLIWCGSLLTPMLDSKYWWGF